MLEAYLEASMESLGDGLVLLLGGFLVGLIFGAGAQASAFCLRSATIEFANWKIGPKFAIWLLAFCSAVAAVQAAVSADWIIPSETRQIGAVGSMSGAIIGGVMFGVGMILARGCASRLLVLSATGNLRALLTGLVVTIIAQASLRGVLSGPRQMLGGFWTVPGGEERNLLSWIGLTAPMASAIALVALLAAVVFAVRTKVSPLAQIAAVFVGLAVAAGWVFTFAASSISFEPIQPGSVSFTGPAADTLMALVDNPVPPLDFSLGLVPGVFFGSMASATLRREIKLQGFEGGPSMLRYLTGACAMGFGAMLAGGCAVGAGVTGGALFSVTAWLALFSMWIGAVACHRLVKS